MTSLVHEPAVTVRAARKPDPGIDRLIVWHPGSELPTEITAQTGERRPAPGGTMTGHHGGARWSVLALPADPTRESSRAAAMAASAALPVDRPGRLHCTVPAGLDDAALVGLIEGLVVGGYSPRSFATDHADTALEITVQDPAGRHDLVEAAWVVARAHCAARDLQNAPANVATPAALVRRARELADSYPALTLTVLHDTQIGAAGMGAFAAVARGAAEPAALIELRYEPPAATGPLTAWVGKCITFDTGGINLKRSGAAMAEMKFDMSGGAAVIEAVGAVAALGLPVRLLAVAGATENMPGRDATHPGDIVTTLAGKTVEITNTDAEGRLVLADCLAHAINAGADRLVDLATLTGSVVTMFGGRYGALMSTDDELAAAVEQAGRDSGELVWRMPLHPWYSTRIASDYADLANCRKDDGAGTLLAGAFLKEFTAGLPWAHIDALAWDLDHEDGPGGGAAYGLRLLIQLACRDAGLTGPGRTTTDPTEGNIST